MTETKEYSSLPLVLAASGTILLSAAIGWFFLGSPAPEPIIHENGAAVLTPAIEADDPSVGLAPIDVDDDVLLPPPALAVTERRTDPAPVDVDSELRKARLAAGADMLVSPPERNALYFYGRIIDTVPDHAEANSEFDAVLARVALIVSDHLSLGNFDDAYSLAVLVAGHRPEHPLVGTLRTSLNDRAGRLIDLAMQHTRDGNDDDAAAALADLEALPGFDAEYVAAARNSIGSARQARIDAERDRIETERLAAELSVIEWTGKVRGAIKSGRLLSPAGDSARDYLAERDEPKESKDALTDELLAALMAAGQQNAETGNVVEAESLINAASDLRADAAGLNEIREVIEQKLIEAEGARVIGINNFVRLNTTPARYPRIANQLNITGWVDVVFTVTPMGSTTDIAVVEAEPENVFDESAIKAVEQWTFQPRQYRGRLINQRTSARLVFRLE